MTPALVARVAELAELVGKRAALSSARELRLRRANRVRTVHASLAIEGNTLTEAQVTALLEGRRVVGPPREVREAQNAIAAYERMGEWEPQSLEDLLAAHAVLMAGLADDAGKLRRSGVGVVSGTRVVHMAPPARQVRRVMTRLLSWLGRTEAHPLVASSLFHYELEFIHPFSDGNGRMGRLWQTLILSEWNPLFIDVPVESRVRDRQREYYRAINESNRKSDARPFLTFMLEAIGDALVVGPATDQVTGQVTDQVADLLRVLGHGELKSAELMSELGLAHRGNFRDRHLKPALESGLVERTQPDSPRSPTQRYRLTAKGRRCLERLAR